jgi:mobilization protein NikA
MSDRQREQPKKKTRSGSETRKRQPRVTFRVSDEEHAAIKASAAAAGLSVGSFLRSLALAAPSTRAVRRAPPPEMEPVKKVLTHGGRIGGNMYQLVRAMNLGEIVRVEDMYAAAKEAREFVAEARQAFGL